MVSKSGKMLRASSPSPGRISPTSLSSSATSSTSDTEFGLRDDVVRHRSRAVAPMGLGRLVDDRQLGGGLLGIVEIGRGQQPRRSDLLDAAVRSAPVRRARRKRCRAAPSPAARRRPAHAHPSSAACRARQDGSRTHRPRAADAATGRARAPPSRWLRASAAARSDRRAARRDGHKAAPPTSAGPAR